MQFVLFLCQPVYRRLLDTPRLGSQAHTDKQGEQPQRAGHEPVCLVPASVDVYLHVPEWGLRSQCWQG